MHEFQAKKRVRRIVFSKFTVVAILLLALFMARAVIGVYGKYAESRASMNQTAQELERLERRQQLLASEIERLSTDEGVEEEIRSKFSVSKANESFLVVVDAATSTEEKPLTSPSWREKLINIFGF